MDNQPQPAIMFPPRPEQTISRGGVGPSTTTTRMVAGPDMLAADADLLRKQEAAAAAAREELAVQQRINDEAAANAAAEAARLQAEAAARAKAQAELKAQTDAVVARYQAQEDRALAQKTADAKITDYWEDRSAPAKVISALLVGMGGYAASRGGGTNTALDIFQRAQADDRAAKEAKYAKSKEAAALAMDQTAAGRARAQEALANQRAEWDRQDIVKGRITAAQLTATAAKNKNPLAQAEAAKVAQAVQVKESEQRQAQAEKFSEKVTRDSGHGTWNTTTNVDKPDPNQGKVTTANKITAGEYEFARDNMIRLRENITKNPKAWAELQNAIRAQKESDALSGNSVTGLGVSLFRGTGTTALSVEQRLKTPEARAIFAQISPYITQVARTMDPSGVISDSIINQAESRSGVMTSSPREMAEKTRVFEKQAARMAKIARGEGSDPGGTIYLDPTSAPVARPTGKAIDAKTVGGKRMVKVHGQWQVLE